MSFLASNVNKARCSCFWVPMAITDEILLSMKQNWYFWVTKLGVTSIFILPCKTSFWLFEWVGGFENYKLWGFHCDIKRKLWNYFFGVEIYLFLGCSFFASEASFLLCFVVFIFFVILHPSWQFKHCLADWVEIHVIRNVTDLAMLNVFVILIKLNWGLMFFCASADLLIICSIRPWYIAWYIMVER